MFAYDSVLQMVKFSSLIRFFKHAWRARSFAFARDYNYSGQARQGVYQYGDIPLYYRAGSSDMSNIHDKLLKEKTEYWLPPMFEPEVVFDIGGNTGIASVYFAERFPNATIHAFEPAKVNYALLEKNVASLSAVKPHPFGLGAEDASMDIFGSNTSFGSYSLYKKEGSSVDVVDTVTVRNTEDVLGELGVKQVDLIKIDTEGFEWVILKSFPQEILANVQWIVGELHSIDDYKLLAYLDQWFDIDIKRTLTKPCCKFNAVNRNHLPKLGKGYDLRALQY